MRPTLLMTLLLVTWSAVEGAIKFDGCFEDIEERHGVTFELENTNINADCAHYCAFTGYILSATQGAKCHCTNRYPPTNSLLQSPHNVSEHGDIMCNTVCPGAAHTISPGGACEGDACCGSTGNRNAYTLYAVGGIDVRSVILKRIRVAIDSGRMPWITDAFTKTCVNDFRRLKYTHNLRVKPAIEAMKCKPPGHGGGIEGCKKECTWEGVDCRSFTYSRKQNQCCLYRKSTREAPLEPADAHTEHYDRVCPEKVDLLPTTFQVDMIDQDFIVDSQPGIHKEPLDSNDFEFDLSNSNNFDTLERSFDSSESETAIFTTDSGFELASASSESSSTTTSTDSTSESSTTTDSSFSANFGVSVKASVEANFFFGSASGSVGFNSNFGVSSSSSNTQSQAYGSSRSSTNSVAEELSRSKSFSSGYSNVLTSTKETSMTYSMTVPALHKGNMAFFKEQRKTVAKLRSTFQLNGYLMFKVDGKEKEVHVSSVLTANERLFATFTTMIFNRPVITAKTTVTS